jgi:hypothetical protein
VIAQSAITGEQRVGDRAERDHGRAAGGYETQ